jgi:FG-GAP-like repeat
MRALALLFLLFQLAPGDPGPFEVVDFGPRGRITRTEFADLDGDGRMEILLFTGHRIRIFAATAEGGYDPAAPIEAEVPTDALFFDLGSLDTADPRQRIFAVTPAGVVEVAFAEKTFAATRKLILPARSLVAAAEEDALSRLDFFRDLDGDGLPDIVLPVAAGFALHYQRREEAGGGFSETPELLIPTVLHASITYDGSRLLGGYVGKVGAPAFLVRDFTGDGKDDFAVDDGRTLAIHPAGEDGRFSEKPKETVDLTVLAGPDGQIPRFKLADVNGDGLPDFLITRRKEGLTDIHLFGQALTKPPVRIKLPGWSFSPHLADLNGDGRLDLAVPTTPEVGVSTAMSVMMTGAMTVTNQIFLNTGDLETPFAKEPDVAREIRVRMKLYVDLTGSIQSAHSVLVDLQGDFNGDGRKDLVYRSGGDEIQIFAGQEEGVFASDASRTVEIPESGEFEDQRSVVKDLNADGRMDLAIICLSRDRLSDSLLLLLSTSEEQE